GKGFADARVLVRKGELFGAPPSKPVEHTTIGVVATNAKLTKAEAQRMALMAHDGFARAITPVHTPFDGDTIFALATGARSEPAPVFLVGALAADVMATAIVRAVREATGVAGVPALRDIAAPK